LIGEGVHNLKFQAMIHPFFFGAKSFCLSEKGFLLLWTMDTHKMKLNFRKQEFSNAPDRDREIGCSKRLRKVAKCNVLLDKIGTEKDDVSSDRIQVDSHQADDDTISTGIDQTASVVGFACENQQASTQNYWRLACKQGLSNFVNERSQFENLPTVMDDIDKRGEVYSCAGGSGGQLLELFPREGAQPHRGQDPLTDSSTPLVQVQAVHCRLDDIVDDLRRGCVAVERDEGLRGRSFLVPAEWGADGCRCAMEVLAMEVFTYHTRGMDFDRGCSGAEWWVQVSCPADSMKGR
jgi:hypothetical protein